jgi:hypothetical protein
MAKPLTVEQRARLEEARARQRATRARINQLAFESRQLARDNLVCPQCGLAWIDCPHNPPFDESKN